MLTHKGFAGETPKRTAIKTQVRRAVLRSRRWQVVLLSLFGLVAILSACSRGTDAGPKAFFQVASQIKTAPSPSPEGTVAPLPHIDAKRAFQYTREVTAFGERYMGNENHKKLERYIIDHLKGDQVEDDAFTADTVEGKFPVRNIIAKFPGTKDGIIVIMGHYDTNYWLRGTGSVSYTHLDVYKRQARSPASCRRLSSSLPWPQIILPFSIICLLYTSRCV